MLHLTFNQRWTGLYKHNPSLEDQNDLATWTANIPDLLSALKSLYFMCFTQMKMENRLKWLLVEKENSFADR